MNTKKKNTSKKTGTSTGKKEYITLSDYMVTKWLSNNKKK